jgi:hypothetical protein
MYAVLLRVNIWNICSEGLVVDLPECVSLIAIRELASEV